MYFHPLQEEIGNMSDEDISKRIKELTRKVAIARRGRNPDMLAQLQKALFTYQDAIRQRSDFIHRSLLKILDGKYYAQVHRLEGFPKKHWTYTILTKNNNFYADGVLVHSEIGE